MIQYTVNILLVLRRGASHLILKICFIPIFKHLFDPIKAIVITHALVT